MQTPAQGEDWRCVVRGRGSVNTRHTQTPAQGDDRLVADAYNEERLSGVDARTRFTNKHQPRATTVW